jgi:hypothetical protein
MSHARRTRRDREPFTQLFLHLASERPLRADDILVRMVVRMVRRMLGPQLGEHRIALLRRHACELLAELDDVGCGRAGAALGECQLAPLAQHDRQENQQRRRDDGDRRREQTTEQRFR